MAIYKNSCQLRRYSFLQFKSRGDDEVGEPVLLYWAFAGALWSSGLLKANDSTGLSTGGQG